MKYIVKIKLIPQKETASNVTDVYAEECTWENGHVDKIAVDPVFYRKKGITQLANKFIKIINSENITYAKAEQALDRAKVLLKNGMISENKDMNDWIEGRSPWIKLM